MNTPTHLLVAAALLSKPGEKTRNRAIIAGALAPDIFIYVMFVWQVLKGTPQTIIWNEIYFGPTSQFFSALSNSIPLGLCLIALGFALKQRFATWGSALLFFALAVLTHQLGDLPVHPGDEAHRHFWPLTNWVFDSPVSYWDPNHHGRLFGLFEALLGLILIAVLWRRFSVKWLRIVLAVLAILYITISGAMIFAMV